jgi:PAS domain S-box-containing protein
MALPGQYFQKLVESCPDIIISVDKQGTIIFYNDGARQNLGFSYEEVLGKNVLEIYPSLDEAGESWRRWRAADASGKGRLRNFETVFKTKKGEKIPVAISASITYDDEGHEIGSIGFAKDIREIRRRDQLVTLGEIAIGWSHEMNKLPGSSGQPNRDAAPICRPRRQRRGLSRRIRSARFFSVSSKKNPGYYQPHQRDGREGEYGTKEYLHGKMMTDLHVENGAKPCDRPSR